MAVDAQGANTGGDQARVAWLYDPKVRGIISQIILVVGVVVFGWWLVSNTIHNLEKQNIASGLGFLEEPAGFGIIQTLVPYSETSTYGRAFLVGLLNTLLVAFLGIIAATILGFLLGVARLSKNWLVSTMAGAYVEIMRNIPLLLHIFIWYFAVLRAVPGPRNSIEIGPGMFVNNRGIYLPAPVFGEGAIWIGIALVVAIIGSFALKKYAMKRLFDTGQVIPVLWPSLAMIFGLPLIAFFATGMPITLNMPELKGFNFRGGMVMIPEFASLFLALSIYTAAYIAEIVRSGIMAVSHGQTEAAMSLGLSRGQSLRLVVVPQALRVIIPPLTSQYLNLTKNSSLATAIAYPDLVSVFAGTVLNQTGQAVEIIFITMGVYLMISLLTSAFMNWYNARVALVER